MDRPTATDTTTINKSMDGSSHSGRVWLFGYGSLIFKADFPFYERRPASIRNWARRFWQGSHDHRGTADSPGRVVTLIPDPGAVCRGVTYRIDSGILEHLDIREKNGYLRVVTELTFDDGEKTEGLVYIATHENGAFLGPAEERDIARHIAASRGPSGHNVDYVTSLADSLRELSVQDEHVFAVERYVLELKDLQRG